MRSGSCACLMLGLLGVGCAALRLLAQLPYDPLTDTEAESARETLLSDPAVKQYLANDERYRILYIQRHELEDKSEDLKAARRADILLYTYTKDESLSAVVRLGEKPKVEAMRFLKSEQPAWTREELDEATNLALADGAVQAKLKAAGITGGAKESLSIFHVPAELAGKEDPCAKHRCVALLFQTGGAVVNLHPVVDLSARKVRLR
jgi:Cu2+-containing amine oxidase